MFILANWETDIKAALPKIYHKWKRSKDTKQTKELVEEVKENVRLLWICQAHLNMELIKVNNEKLDDDNTDNNMVVGLSESPSETKKLHEKRNKIKKLKKRAKVKQREETEV